MKKIDMQRLQTLIESKTGAMVLATIDEIMQNISNGNASSGTFTAWNEQEEYGVKFTLEFVSYKENVQ